MRTEPLRRQVNSFGTIKVWRYVLGEASGRCPVGSQFLELAEAQILTYTEFRTEHERQILLHRTAETWAEGNTRHSVLVAQLD